MTNCTWAVAVLCGQSAYLESSMLGNRVWPVKKLNPGYWRGMHSVQSSRKTLHCTYASCKESCMLNGHSLNALVGEWPSLLFHLLPLVPHILHSRRHTRTSVIIRICTRTAQNLVQSVTSSLRIM
jgi:hypothetical protein